MKTLVSKRSIIIASTALLLAIITLISVNVFNSAGPVTGFANAVTRPVRALVTTVARTFGNIFASMYRYEELLKRNEQLLQTITQLQSDFRDSEALAAENAQFRELLGFRERHGGVTDEMATLTGWTSDNWTSTFTINRGYSNSGIMQGMAVTTEYGVLIGQVFEVGAIESTVITVLDTKFSAAAFIGGDGRDDAADGTATVKGDFSFLRSGLLIIDHIDDDLSVIPGTTVFTSGLAAVFPPGLNVGEVVAVYPHSNGIGRYATVRPSRDIDTTIQTVFVILDFENPE